MSEISPKMPWKPFLAFALIWGVIAGVLQTILMRWVVGAVPEITWSLVLANAIIWFFATLAFSAWLRWRAIKRMKAKELENSAPEE